jgi:hypothetical protein
MHERNAQIMKPARRIAGLAACLTVLALLLIVPLAHRLGWTPGWGGGEGAVPDGAQQAGVAALSSQPADAAPQPVKPPQPLRITIDDKKYLVGDNPVESVAELVKMAAAVPKEVPPPRVLIHRQPTARYTVEKELLDALRAANIDVAVEK